MKARPNILWICTEHQRFNTVHALGNAHIRTPNLDRLVAEGVAFTHAFCQNPVCTPSRSSFLTGRYPVTTGCRQNGQNLPEDEVLITRVLRDWGYDCGLSGKFHVSASQSGSERRVDDGYGMFAWSHGSTENAGGDWVEWLQKEGQAVDDLYLRGKVLLSREVQSRTYHQTTWCFDRALEFMGERRDGPWLMSVNPFSVHDPFDFLPEIYAYYNPDALPEPAYRPGELENKTPQQQAAHARFEATTPEARQEMIAAYYATVEHIDAEVGRVLDWLEAQGERENTLVIFQSDHGEMLGDHGLFQKGPFLYDQALRIPLILSCPGHLPAGERRDGFVELVDLVPTIYELLGEAVPERVQGKSLMPLINCEIGPDAHRDGIYAEYYNSNPARPAPHGHGRATYATVWREREAKIVVYHGETFGELYDLKRDPDEFENRWDDPDYAVLRFEMMAKCFDARVFAMDPLPERVSNF